MTISSLNSNYFLQHNDDPELWSELKRKEVEYERRRNKRVQYFESVRTAQTVQIEDIPLPDMCEKPAAPASQPQLPFGSVPIPPPNFPPQIPPGGVPIPPSIQNAIAAHQKAQAEEKKASSEPKRKDPPGCPPGPPPDLVLMRDLDSDYETDDSDRGRNSPVSKRYKSSDRRRYSSDRSSNQSSDRNSDSENEVDVPKPTSVQQRMLAIAGQKYDDFMKELENVHSQSDDRQSSKQSDRHRSDDDSRSDGDSRDRGRDRDRDSDEAKKNLNESNLNTYERKQDNEHNAGQAMRKENPAAIPNISAVPAPPMPPPMMQNKMPRPPPPPMGEFYTKILYNTILLQLTG